MSGPTKIFRWVKTNYFSGTYRTNYQIAKKVNWEDTLENFLEEKIKADKSNKGLYIAVSQSVVTITLERPSGLRPPGNTASTYAEITETGSTLNVFVEADLGYYSATFLPIWKGFVLTLSIIFVTIWCFIIASGNASADMLLGVLVLLILNGACWISTIMLKGEAQSMLSRINRIIEKK